MKRININDYSNKELQVKKDRENEIWKESKKNEKGLTIGGRRCYIQQKSVLATSSTIIRGMIWF